MSPLARWQRLALFATVFLVGAMVVGAFFHNEFRAQNWDPQQTRDYVERTIRFGGTFYENGLHNKGPLEPMVYRLAALVTSWNGFWYAISFFVLIVSGLIAWAASNTARALGGHRLLGVAIGIAVFFHFALGKADYAGVLYSRNMVVGLLAGAWLIALAPRSWVPRRAQWSSLAVGVLLGLATQTLFVSAIAAFAVGLLAWNALHDIDDDALYRRCRRILAITPAAVTVAAPAYYLIRNRFQEFWSGWWTYAKYQNTGTGRSLANQLVYGRDVILRYYRSWPVSLVIVTTFVVITVSLWRTLDRRERTVHLSIMVWFLGAWTELVMGQRYSSHYFSILAVPTALMAATIVGHAYRLLQRARGEFRSVVAWPLVACLFSIVAMGGGHLNQGLQAASSFNSVSQSAKGRQAVELGPTRTVRATLDLVSKADDPLLAWTEFPWTYLNVRRVAATRFIWKSFMMGQIYLGRTGPQYVLPKTWQWFDEDMHQANPSAFLEETAMPLSQGNPFADYVNEEFTQVFAGADYNIYLRNDQADDVLRGQPGAQMSPTRTQGTTSKWVVGSGTASLAADVAPNADDLLQLSPGLCSRISGTYTAVPGTAGSFLSFRFDSARASDEKMRLNIADRQVFSGNDNTVFESVALDPPSTDTGEPPPPDTATHEFAVVIGKYSAALVIDGQIRAAVRLTTQTHLSLEMRNGGVELAGLHVGPPPPDSGCPG
ncbi:unannotated protein [freshwater metagenome]|uniref:Unannotated protein n=1 Tax=freshwater metagenome TaxID=449393 RepID=A0A6J7EV45_9ZZZZ|nr:hypothetical protein [Actinomycetota bacterium]